MKFGLFAINMGPCSDPVTAVRVAQAAEAAGFDPAVSLAFVAAHTQRVNRRRPAWEAFVALVGQGFFGGGSRNGITQYARARPGTRRLARRLW